MCKRIPLHEGHAVWNTICDRRNYNNSIYTRHVCILYIILDIDRYTSTEYECGFLIVCFFRNIRRVHMWSSSVVIYLFPITIYIVLIGSKYEFAGKSSVGFFLDNPSVFLSIAHSTDLESTVENMTFVRAPKRVLPACHQNKRVWKANDRKSYYSLLHYNIVHKYCT